MDKCAIFLFMTVLFISLTIVSAEEVSQDTVDIQTTDTIQQTSSISHQVQAVSDNNDQKENLKISNKSSNSTQKQETNVIHKEKTNNLKADASQDLSAIESSTKTKLENAFSQAKIEINNAQSTYEKEQIPSSVKEIANQIAAEAERAERIYAESGDQSLIATLNKIRNYAGYADLLIHPEKLTDPEWASRYRTRPLDKIGDKYNLFTIVAQKLNGTQESVYINLTSDEFQNLYNDVGEIHHPGEFDKYGNVQLVNKTNFIQITPDPTEFELIPFPFARIYLEDSYKRGYPYTMTFASCANASGGWYHVYGSTLTKQTYLNHTLNEIVEGNSGIAFWRMIKTNNPNMKYVLTDERYYPDKDGHPPYNMPAENGDDNGIYFVGYVIKSETGGIHIDGVIVEYRVPEDTHDVNFTVKKVWNDTNNQDGMRPTTITVELLADGEKYGDHIVLHQNNNWTYDYVNLPRYNQNRDEVVYTIHEVSIPTGYRVSYNNYTITNTHIPETKNIEVLKEWDDDYNRDGIRPKSVTVDLYANGALKDTVVINASNWRYTFNNLPVYSNGNKINYTIQERSVNGYTTTIRNVSNDFIITNSYTPRVRNVTVKKVWNDSNNQDGIRPNSITVQLLKDETPYLDAVTLNSNNNWTYTFNNIPVNQNGKAITYTAIETNIPSGYNATNNGLTITNTHIPEVTQLNVLKVWNDDSNRDGLRPGSVTVDLYANNVLRQTVVINASNWRYTFNNLPVYSNGNKINYTVNERSISGYNSTVRKNGNEFTITNTHIPSVRNVTVRKVWNDSNNQDGIRPGSVSIQLLMDETPYLDAVTLNANNNWTYTFRNLPVNLNGKAIRYTAFEMGIPAGYTAVNDGLTITNTHVPVKTQLEVFKEWDDDHNRDGIRPSSITVSLYANNVLKDTVVINETNWRYTFKDLPVYSNGNRINYTINERVIANYTTRVQSNNNEFTITNTHVPSVRDVTVRKVWNDSNNQDGIRPGSVSIQLLMDETPYLDAVTLNSNNNWTYTFRNLPVNLNGKAIRYTAFEMGIPAGYTAVNDGLTITNTHIPIKTQLEVFKEWDDDYNRDGIRPNSVVVNLLADDAVVDEISLSSDNQWRYIFEDLAVYKDGKKITYTVEENEIANYTSTSTNDNGNFIIINSHKPVEKELNVIKVWDDHENEHNTRPDSVQVQLFANGEKYGESVTLTASTGWKYTFTNLPVNFDGKEILYVVKEVILPEEYYNTIELTANNEITITNIFDPEHAHVKVIKEWDDNHDSDKLRPSSIQVQLYANGVKQGEPVTLSQSNYWRYSFENLLKYVSDGEVEYTVEEVTKTDGYNSTIQTLAKNEYAIINTHIPEKVNITINKVWNDSDNQDGLRPETTTIDLLANGEIVDSVVLSDSNDWTYTFVDLDKNYDGNLINYTVNEVGMPDGYTVSYDGYTITNTHVPEVIELHVVKEWIANFNQDGLRPDSVEVQLNVGDEVIETVSLSEGNNWTYIFRELPRFADGSEIEYTVTETPVPGYTTTVVNNDNKVIIRNVHIPETINITINKVWNDSDNQDGIRPTTALVELLANGEKVKTVSVSDSNSWSYTFVNLNKYYNGALINYTVNEVGIPDGYTVAYDGYTITNTHVPEVIELHVVKEWVANYNQDGLRPDSVEVQLNKGDEVLETVELSESNNWTYIFKDLAKYDAGEEIGYTITETPVEGYTTTVVNNSGKIVIRNEHIPETINITINKVWEDSDNQDGIRPTTALVELLANGEKVETVSVSDSNSWSYTFVNLNKYYNGALINYTVNEVGIPDGYTVAYDGYTITNTHVPEVIELHVVKEWVANYNQDGLRPDSVEVQLNKDGEVLETVQLSESNNWTYLFKNLPRYNAGEEIEYEVAETPVDGYTTTIVYNDSKVIIRNVHIPEKINITINKVWEDNDNQDAIRPDSVTIELLANGEKINTVVLSESNNWENTFTDLDKYHNGTLINYTTNELGTPEGYNVSYEGYTITNTHIPETIDVIVIVTWDDLDNIDEIRPDNVTIIIYKNGEPIENRTVNPEDDWRSVFEDLPKYENGTLINYTADEILPDGYTRTIEINEYKIIINNIHRPELINITVQKVWDDDNNRDNIRPQNITVVLVADGKENATVTLSAQDNWEYLFINLPKTKKGVEIVYTIKEIDNINNYTTTYEGFTITNKHEPETVNLTVNVIWDDLDDIDKIRPENVTIIIYADGEPIENRTITPDDDWKTIFEDLPKYENGTEINYTADEILPDGYTKTIDINDNEVNITNIHRPEEKVNITVIVEWDDLDDQDGIRPDNVTIIIYADGEPIINKTITPDDNWTSIFEDLPKYKDGTEINYTADEILPDGYTKTIDINDNVITITNIHRPETIDITVDIVWDDLDDQDGIRPDNVTIILYENGKPIQNITVTKDTWNTVFENLPKYKDGNEINYTIDEVLPNGYTKTIDVDGTHFTVTNIHRPETKDIPVTIKWDDLEDIDGIRPGNVTLILYADGKEVSRITITPEDNWKTIFENLPVNANGKPIKYTVDEVLPNGYTKTINETEEGFIITNIHRPQLVWTWKLVEIIQEDEPNDNPDNITPTDKPTGKIDKQQPRTNKQFTRYNNAKTYSNYARYNRYNRYNNYNRYSRYNRGYNNKVVPTISKRLYRLYIQLYNQYLEGKISLADFIVILEKEGLDPQILNFNEDGTITIDYDSLEKVPDKITVQYKNDNIPTTSDEIDTSNPDNNEAPVIDSGEVKVPTTTQSSSNSNNGQSSSSQSSPSQSSSSQSSDAE